MFSAEKFIKFKCLIITYILCTLQIHIKLYSPASHITRSKEYPTILSPGSRRGPKRWGEWNQVSAQGKRWIPSWPTSPSQVPSYNRCEALEVRVRHTATRRKVRRLGDCPGWITLPDTPWLPQLWKKVIHDSFLREIEGSVWWYQIQTIGKSAASLGSRLEM